MKLTNTQLCCWLLILVSGIVSSQEKERVNLVKNPGFEEVSPSDAKTNEKWELSGDTLVPGQWRLSPAFPGKLESVTSGGTVENRLIRVTAGEKRDAHLYQACPDVRQGLAYEVTLRHRGGPVELRMYEYDKEGRLSAEYQFSRSDGEASWQDLIGYYMLPEGVTKVSLVMVVSAGGTADLDEIQMVGFERSSEKLNVRNVGVSGSSFETSCATTAGSSTVSVENPGDFQVGHGVALFNCNPHFTDGLVWDVSGEGSREGNFEEQVELRGYDGSSGDGVGYLLDFKGGESPSFRWSDDLGQSWKKEVKVTGGWQKLNSGIEVRLVNREFWIKPRLVSFTARNHLFSRVVKIDQQKLTLAHPVPTTADKCVLQHDDTVSLQRALDRAVGEQRNVFLPSGRYRLSRGLILNRPNGISIEGENEDSTVLDISTGQGACITVEGGSSVLFRRLRFRGFSSFSDMKKMAYLPTDGYPHMWGFFARHCNALTFRSPERALIENCHATGMSAECFYSGSRSRKGNEKPPAGYPKSITYRNCSVSDCARNAFNNNDFAENTSVVDCRVENIGGCAWEGASRFVKISGNYITNAGPVAIGNIRSREEHFDTLPSGQHLVTNNTFEGELAYGNSYIGVTAGATPVIIKNNIFVNLNASAIEVSGHGNARNLPAANMIITGNAIDLTCVNGESRRRIGISVSTNDSTISDNQIYTRKGMDPMVTGILLAEPAHNLVVHDNIIRTCSVGLEAKRTKGSVGEIIDSKTFKSNGRMPWSRRDGFRYPGYQIVWIPNYQKPEELADGPVIETFDPDAGVFRLREDFDLKMNAVFVVRAPEGFFWNIHHNLISDCSRLVDLNVFGGPASLFSDNILKRSGIDTHEAAVKIQGQFQRANNQYSGFKKPE